MTQGNTRDAERRTSQTRVAVFRGLPGIGDFLVAVPALRVLRASLPNAAMALIAPEDVRPLAMRFSDLFDDFVPFTGWPGLAEGEGSHECAAEETPRERDVAAGLEEWRGCDAVIQMHGDGTSSNVFCASLEPKTIVAYGPEPGASLSRFDTRPYPRELREVERCHRLARRAVRVLGATPVADDTRLRFDITEEDRMRARSVLADAGGVSVHDYFVIHPGSKRADNQWPAERFARVGRTLTDFGIVVVTGTSSESVVADEVAKLIEARAVSLAGRLDLGALAALIAEARGVVTNDTGVSHLADAVGTRSVVVFVASDPHRWAPDDESLHRKAVAWADEGEPGTLTPEGARLVPPPVSTVLDAAIGVGMIH